MTTNPEIAQYAIRQTGNHLNRHMQICLGYNYQTRWPTNFNTQQMTLTQKYIF